MNEDVEDEIGEAGVPTDLLELHLELEDKGVTPDRFKEVFGEAGNQS